MSYGAELALNIDALTAATKPSMDLKRIVTQILGRPNLLQQIESTQSREQKDAILKSEFGLVLDDVLVSEMHGILQQMSRELVPHMHLSDGFWEGVLDGAALAVAAAAAAC